MTKHRSIAVILLALSILGGYFIYSSEVKKSDFAFKLGLDLSGGTHLVYKADTSDIADGDVQASMSSLRDVIERRVNLFGVSEPVVQVEEGGVVGGGGHKLIVELPGVTDVNKAVALIGKTPVLEFKLVNEAALTDLQAQIQALGPDGKPIDISTAPASKGEPFISTGLTGRLLDRAELEFDQRTGEPQVSVQFNTEGSELFAKITKENVGKRIAIFLDGTVISSPVVREEISGGKAQISGGSMTSKEAQSIVRDLNYGALPVPITLEGTQKIGASLGASALHASVQSGIWAFAFIALFLILWYRLPGLLASVSLAIYVVIMLLLFQAIPVVLTSAGLAGFILSVGMAVDANILIFERMKEEFKRGRDIHSGIFEGFARAWFSIRDGNLSSLITAAILFWLSSTPLVKGFALIFGLGVLVSMFTAITVSRTFLLAVAPKSHGKVSTFLFNNGFKN
ncbi:MAG: protein translocase subunit SecD [Patescibacteria group bacterium]